MRKEKIVELEKNLENFDVINDKKIMINYQNNTDCENNSYEMLTNHIINKNVSIVLPLTIENDVIFTIKPNILKEGNVSLEFPLNVIKDYEKSYDSVSESLMKTIGCSTNSLISLGKFYQNNTNYYYEYYVANNCVRCLSFIDNKLFKCTFKEALELIDLGYILNKNVVSLLKKKNEKELERVKK